MPRTKSKPIHRARDPDARNQEFSEIFAEQESSELEVTEPSPKKKQRSKRESTCFYSIWTIETCDFLKRGKPIVITTLSTNESIYLGTIEIPPNNLKDIPVERLVLSLTNGVIFFSDSESNGSIVCHYHLPPQVSHAISSLNKTALSYQFVCNNRSSFCIHFFILATSSIMPSLLTWLQPEKFSTFYWYGHNCDLQINSNMFLSSFATTWEIESKDKLVSLTNEIRSAGIATNLRQYQLEGIDWMWHMLTLPSSHHMTPVRTYPGWVSIDESQSVYYNEIWKLFLKKTDLTTNNISPSSISSCILADEMGIGKSLQVLAFILLLRRRIECGLYLEKNEFGSNLQKQISSFFEFREAAISSSLQRQRRKSAVRSEVGCEIPCLCERSECEESDIGWVSCSICRRRRHLRCANLMEPDDQYQCLSCTSTYFYHNPIHSKTTLIIIPGTLTNQWLNEVKRHVNRNTSLRVCVYRGKKTAENLSKLTPQFLSTFDIIFISFKALKLCFHEADLDWSTTVNTNRRYDVFPPPLLGLEFSLIVIDETQNIEGATENMILKMAMKLRTRRKLSVSGTPFGGGTVKDLLHLAQFLEIPPFHTNDKMIHQWATFFEHPVLPISVNMREQWLKELFEPRILRRTKDMVREQLGIAERFTLIRSLHMSDFEKKLYVDNVQAINNDLMSRSVSVQFEELGKAKIELIRKACCHPRIFDPSLQLGRVVNLGGSSSSLSSTNSIDNIMIMKVEQTKIRCEEAQRDLLFYLFKLAGLRLLQAEASASTVEARTFQTSAVTIYQLAINLINQHRSSSSSFALFQLVGDDYFDNSHSVIPCFASLSLTWTIFDYVSPMQVENTHSWSSSILESLEKNGDLLSADQTMTTMFVSNEWNPFVRLSMMHKKTVLDIEVAPVATWELEQYCTEQMNATLKSESLLVLFPSEFSLFASDFHDSFHTVVTKTTSSPSIYFSLPSSTSCVSPTANVKFQAERTYRAKQWKISVQSCHTTALLVSRKVDPLLNAGVFDSSLQFEWVSLAQFSPKNSQLRMWAKFSLFETLFDTDLLQELHVQYNVYQTLRQLSPTPLSHEAGSEAELIDNVDDTSILIVTSVNQLTQFSPNNAQEISNDNIVSHRHNTDRFNLITSQAEKRKSFIEKDFLGSAVERRNFAYYKWQEAMEKVQMLENEILEKSESRDWWSGFIMEKLQYHDGFWQDVVDTVERGELAYANLRSTITMSSSVASGIAGLLIALRKEFVDMTKARKAALKTMQTLNSTPTELEIAQASNCQQCRAYFQRQGGICAHCQRFNQYLQPYQKKFLTAARRRTTHVVSSSSTSLSISTTPKNKQSQQKLGGVDSLFHDQEQLTTRAFEEGVVDGTYAMLMKLLKKHAARALPTNNNSNESDDNNSSSVEDRNILLQLMKLEIQWVEAVLQEAQAMVVLWDRYSELLKTYDEIQQCVSRVQLAGSVNPGMEGAESFHSSELPTEYQATMYEAIQAETYLKETMSTLHFFRRQLEHYNQEMLQLAAFEYNQQRHKYEMKEGEPESSASNPPLSAETNEICGICQETMLLTEARVFLPCAHRFHVDCVNSWLQRHRRCPYCRNPTTEQDVRVLQAASSGSSDKADVKRPALTLHKATKSSTLEVFDSNGHVVNTFPQMTAVEEDSVIAYVATGAGEDFTRMLKRVKGRWGTKIDALLADILLIMQNPARREEKGIIFSQWTEMLEIVADALRMNDIRFTCCFNRQRDFEQQGVGIEAFRHNPDLRLLLMPLHLGAEGLDLIVANHVFLLEPLLNYSQEAQAINRIDRLGQLQKATFVHKYLLLETIEERIVAVQQRQMTSDMDPDADPNLTSEIVQHGEEENPQVRSDDAMRMNNSTSTWTPHNNPPATQQQRMTSPSRTQSVTSTKKRKKAVGDDGLLDVDDVRYILSLTSPSSHTMGTSANNSNSTAMEAISSLQT